MVITCQHLLMMGGCCDGGGGGGGGTLTIFQNRQLSHRFCLVHLIRGEIRAGALQWRTGWRRRQETREESLSSPSNYF